MLLPPLHRHPPLSAGVDMGGWSDEWVSQLTAIDGPSVKWPHTVPESFHFRLRSALSCLIKLCFGSSTQQDSNNVTGTRVLRRQAR